MLALEVSKVLVLFLDNSKLLLVAALELFYLLLAVLDISKTSLYYLCSRYVHNFILVPYISKHLVPAPDTSNALVLFLDASKVFTLASNSCLQTF